MIIIYGTGPIDPSFVDRVRIAAEEFVAKTRQEPGCLDYILSWEMNDPTQHNLIEVWETEKHYQSHREQAHTAVFRDLMKLAERGTRRFYKHVATRVEH